MGKARYILTFALWLGLGSVVYGQVAANFLTFSNKTVTIDLNTAIPERMRGVYIGSTLFQTNVPLWSGGICNLKFQSVVPKPKNPNDVAIPGRLGNGFTSTSFNRGPRISFLVKENYALGLKKTAVFKCTYTMGTATDVVTLIIIPKGQGQQPSGSGTPPIPRPTSRMAYKMNVPVGRIFIYKNGVLLPPPGAKKNPPSGPYKLRMSLRLKKRLPTPVKPRP